MQELNEKQIDEVSGGENIIDRIHRYEYNSFGVPLINSAIYFWNMLGGNAEYVTPREAPED